MSLLASLACCCCCGYFLKPMYVEAVWGKQGNQRSTDITSSRLQQHCRHCRHVLSHVTGTHHQCHTRMVRLKVPVRVKAAQWLLMTQSWAMTGCVILGRWYSTIGYPSPGIGVPLWDAAYVQLKQETENIYMMEQKPCVIVTTCITAVP